MKGTLPEWIAAARAGGVRELARLVSLVEDGTEQVPELMAELAGSGGQALVVGITGAPGVGKSTSTSALVSAYRATDKRVAVIAVDPSSPFSGGALLGDRIRMQDHATDPGVYIRSMASRGHLGGLSATTTQVLRVLEGVGFDVIIIETVGVGQSEVEIAGAADTTVVLLAPGMGDGIQAAKAGILEVGDIFVVNKADRDGADVTAREIRAMLTLGQRSDSEWVPPVLKTVASRGEGVLDVVEAIGDHRSWLEASGQLIERRRQRAQDEVESIALARVRQAWRASGALAAAAHRVAEQQSDAFTAAKDLAES